MRFNGKMIVVLFLMLCTTITVVGEDPISGLLEKRKWQSFKENETRERLLLYYFGSSGCHGCKMPETVNAVKKIKNELGKKYPQFETIFIMVCMDTDFMKGVWFTQAYGSWNEISFGGHFKNENCLRYFPTSKAPLIPHILVFRDTLCFKKKTAYFSKNRRKVVDIFGYDEFESWIKEGYPLDAKRPNQ